MSDASRDSLATVLDTMKTIIAGLESNHAVSAHILAGWVNGLGDPHFPLVVLGSYGSGKSRLIDALLTIQRPRIGGQHLFTSGTTPRITLRDRQPEGAVVEVADLDALSDDERAAIGTVEWQLAGSWLGEHVQLIDLAEGDDLVTHESVGYLATAKAFVIVLNAARVFSQSERALLAGLLGERNARQVFIVINNTEAVDADDLSDVQQWVQTTLQPYFKNADGAFDEVAYQQRVLYVSTKDATSVVRLREHVRMFLANVDECTAAAQAAAVQVAAYAVGGVQQDAFDQLEHVKQLEQEHATLHAAYERTINDLNRQEAELRRQIIDIGDTIKLKLYNSLMRHIDTIYERWETDVSHMIAQDDLAFMPMLSATISIEQRTLLRMTISQTVQTYLHRQFEAWIAQVPEMLAPETARLSALLQNGVALQIATLDNALRLGHDQSIDQQQMQAVLAAMLRHVAFGGHELNQIVRRLVVRASLGLVLLFGGLPLLQMSSAAALIALEAKSTSDEVAAARKQMLEQARDQVIAPLRQELSSDELSLLSFTNVESFMELVDKGAHPLLRKLRGLLPSAIQAALQRANIEDQERFVQALNSIVRQPNLALADTVDRAELPSEVNYLVDHMINPAQVNRMVLTVTFPQHLRPKVRDALYASLDQQLDQIAEQTYALVRQHAQQQIALAEQQLTTVQRAVQEAADRQAQLAATTRQLRDLLDDAGRQVYGKPFTDEEVAAMYARKQPLFMA